MKQNLTDKQIDLYNLMHEEDELIYGGNGISIDKFLKVYPTDKMAHDAYNKFMADGKIPYEVMKLIGDGYTGRKKTTSTKPKRKPVKCSCKKK